MLTSSSQAPSQKVQKSRTEPAEKWALLNVNFCFSLPTNAKNISLDVAEQRNDYQESYVYS